MAITEQTLGARHRDWVTALPEIHILAVRVKSDTARQPCAGRPVPLWSASGCVAIVGTGNDGHIAEERLHG
ncbi:hypothetical protein IU427_33855 [Nocardia beijingensis]|uniref:hypothetical protein n=1 Tax=Nocardia beijingensis TaxID=95162 RepID=UPI0018953EBD|nr:hypothetical protein [Nocardia beijingensis]MBF6470100.1 hypothetical protein [Nocardia beijingensis]